MEVELTEARACEFLGERLFFRPSLGVPWRRPSSIFGFASGGARLDPSQLSSLIGVEPSRTFRVGEVRGATANKVAGWEWVSSEGPDDEKLVGELLDTLGSHTEVLHSCTAAITLTVVGVVRGDVVETTGEAERRRWHVESDRPFEPFLDVDRVGLTLSPEAIRFLADSGASYQTHIEAEYEPLSE